MRFFSGGCNNVFFFEIRVTSNFSVQHTLIVMMIIFWSITRTTSQIFIKFTNPGMSFHFQHIRCYTCTRNLPSCFHRLRSRCNVWPGPPRTHPRLEIFKNTHTHTFQTSCEIVNRSTPVYLSLREYKHIILILVIIILTNKTR